MFSLAARRLLIFSRQLNQVRILCVENSFSNICVVIYLRIRHHNQWHNNLFLNDPLGISQCCNGRYPHANGYRWRFYEGPPIDCKYFTFVTYIQYKYIYVFIYMIHIYTYVLILTVPVIFCNVHAVCIRPYFHIYL